MLRRYEIYLLMEKRFTNSFTARTREIFFPWEDKLHIFKPTCNFFLLHRNKCFKNKKKTRRKTKEKQRNDVNDIFTRVRIWKIPHPYPGCSFVRKIRVVYFSLKHSYLCTKRDPYLRYICQNVQYIAWGTLNYTALYCIYKSQSSLLWTY